jgi:hypothetical protein
MRCQGLALTVPVVHTQLVPHRETNWQQLPTVAHGPLGWAVVSAHTVNTNTNTVCRTLLPCIGRMMVAGCLSFEHG